MKVLLILSRFLIEINILIFVFVGQMILSINSRRNEYDADWFAYDVGFGDELKEALYILQKMSLSEKMTISQRLRVSHPILALRINKLEELIYEE